MTKTARTRYTIGGAFGSSDEESATDRMKGSDVQPCLGRLACRG